METPLFNFYRNHVGHDSEFFLWDKQKSEVVSAHEFLPTKDQALELSFDRFKSGDITDEERKATGGFYSSGGKIFRDGLAAEVNSPPSSCVAFLWNDVSLVLRAAARKLKLPENITFTSKPWVRVSKELVATFPEDLLELGCSPTFNAYTGEVNRINVNPRTMGYRTSGSHLHFSYDGSMSDVESRFIIKFADLMIGLPFVWMFNDPLEFERRKLYGRAGEHRLQNYGPKQWGSNKGQDQLGLEYRVLSSRMWDHPAIASTFFQVWKQYCANPEVLKEAFKLWDPKVEDTLQEAINENSPKARAELRPMWEKFVNLRSKQQPSNSFPANVERLNTIFTKAPEAARDAFLYSEKFVEGHVGFSEFAYFWGEDKNIPLEERFIRQIPGMENYRKPPLVTRKPPAVQPQAAA